MSNEFGPEDVVFVNRILRHHPDIKATIQILKQIELKAKYPISSNVELIDILGGEEAQLSYLGQRLDVAEIRRAIPPYYFPIGSQDDLIAKILDLQAHFQSRANTRYVIPDVAGGERAQLGGLMLERPKDIPDPPKLSDAQLHAMAVEGARHRVPPPS